MSQHTALALLAEGLWPIPIKAEGKAPIGTAWGVTRPTVEGLKAVYQENPGAGVGILLGPKGGVIDVEVDGPGGEESFLKLCGGEVVQTRGWTSARGPHRIFAWEPWLAKYGKSIIKHPDLPGLEIRVGGGEVQLQSNCPPTPGSDGEPRQWTGPNEISTLPYAAKYLLDGLFATPKAPVKKFSSMCPAKPSLSSSSAYVAKAVEAECQRVEMEVDGHRNDTLNKAAFNLGQLVGAGVLSLEEARSALLNAARAYIASDGEGMAERTIRSGLLDGMAEPRDLSHVSQPSMPVAARQSEPAEGDETFELQAQDQAALVDGKGRWLSCARNSKLWLLGKEIQIAYDSFRCSIMLNGKPLEDEDVISLTIQLEQDLLRPWNQEHVRSAIVDIAHDRKFSSLTSWLDSLSWDGIERIDHFFPDYFGASFDTYSSACSRVFFLSAVARAYQPGCKADVMPVLIGSQGVGKSAGMALLCPHSEWFADDLGCDLHDRKAGEGLRGKWIVEWSEFSRISRTTAEVYKGFLSRQSDYFRPAYGRSHKDYPRQCVFFGTTNNETPLQDEENRRFMPIHVVAAEFKAIEDARDQLWAEAVARYRKGESWWKIDHQLASVIREKQEDARVVDDWESFLSEYFADSEELVMRDVLAVLGITRDKLDRSTQTRIGMCLKRMGFEKQRRRVGDRAREYYWTKAAPTLDSPYLVGTWDRTSA